jgi:hypothetical protein
LLDKIVREEPRRLDAAPEMRAIVEKCLKKVPDDRFQSIVEVREALRRCIESPDALATIFRVLEMFRLKKGFDLKTGFVDRQNVTFAVLRGFGFAVFAVRPECLPSVLIVEKIIT